MWLRQVAVSGGVYVVQRGVRVAVRRAVSCFVLVLGAFQGLRQFSCCCVVRCSLVCLCCVARFVVLLCVVVCGFVCCVGVSLVFGYVLLCCVVLCHVVRRKKYLRTVGGHRQSLHCQLHIAGACKTPGRPQTASGCATTVKFLGFRKRWWHTKNAGMKCQRLSVVTVPWQAESIPQINLLYSTVKQVDLGNAALLWAHSSCAMLW